MSAADEADPLDIMELAGPQVSRRSVVAALPLAALPFAAFADENDDSMAAIAAKSAAINAAAKKSFKPPTEEELEAKKEKSKSLIIGIAGFGTLASGAFIIPNLQRLATKVTTGGQDSGYGTAKDKQFRAAKAKPKAKAKSAPKKGGLFGRQAAAEPKSAPKKGGFFGR
jgi:hypothetical protein